MNILAFELSTARGSVAWRSSDQSVTSREWPNDRKNSGPFFAAVEEMLREKGKPDTIVVGLGPGSYAGVRIALSTAIGLQAATEAKLIGSPSICAMSDSANDYWVIGDARRQSFFIATIRNRELENEPQLVDAGELQKRLMELPADLPVLTSDALGLKRARESFPSAAWLAELAADERRRFALPPLQPMYLREPHITYPKNQFKIVHGPK